LELGNYLEIVSCFLEIYRLNKMINLSKQKNTSPRELGLKMIKQCPVCKASFEIGEIEMVGETDEGQVLLHFSCGKCSSCLVAKLTPMPFGMVGQAMLTDLDSGEAVSVMGQEEVGDDGLIEIYRRLESGK